MCLAPALRAQDSLEKLSTDFWTWRAETAPFNDDDIPRMERPARPETALGPPHPSQNNAPISPLSKPATKKSTPPNGKSLSKSTIA